MPAALILVSLTARAASDSVALVRSFKSGSRYWSVTGVMDMEKGPREELWAFRKKMIHKAPKTLKSNTPILHFIPSFYL